VVFLCAPIYWCRTKYNQNLRDLGFVKGDHSIATFFLVGIAVAAIYTIILKLLPTWKASAFNEFSIQNNLIYVLLLPISIDGFLYIIFGPLSEETMFRGFLYGILRKKYGFVIAAIAQTILFGFFHVDFFKGQIISQLIIRMIPGIIFVAFVEKFNSILPAIISHAFINYFLIILSMSI
jgi:membrane protease YdiL (CAAX protease family)